MTRYINASYIRRRFNEGARLSDVVRELDCSREAVVSHCRMHDIPLPKPQYGPSRKLPPTAAIVERLRSGESATEIAKQAGVTRSAVIETLKRDGYAYRGGVVSEVAANG
jgi:DNA invertase Pin-like site-specific DNA recombinase